MKVFAAFLLLLSICGICPLLKVDAANILCLVGTARHNNPSWTQPLFAGLASRGHSLTVLSTAPEQNVKGIKHIYLPNDYDVVGKHFVDKDTGHYREQWNVKQLLIWYEALLGNCRALTESEVMQKRRKKIFDEINLDYDLIIYDATYNMDCLLQMLPTFQVIPILGVSAGKLSTDLLTMMQAEDTISPAKIPHFISDFPKKMTYWRRILNHIMYLGEVFINMAVVQPAVQGMLKKNFAYPSVELMLLNTHPVLDYIQNMPPNIIEVGGLHIRSESAPMPPNIQDFMDEFVDGIVYINLPHIEMMFGLGIEAVMQMVKNHSQYGFIWNVEGMKKLPEKWPNLMTVHMGNEMQQNVLAQANVRAFLTHGDSFSLQEAIYHAVPVVVLPLILEEFNNAQRIAERYLGLVIDYSSFTVNRFSAALKRLLNDAYYTNALYQAQIKFRTRPLAPVDMAIWHAEHLISEPKLFKYLAQPANYAQNYFVAHSWDVLCWPLLFVFIFLLNLGLLIYQIYQGYQLDKSIKEVEALAADKPKRLKKKVKKKPVEGEATEEPSVEAKKEV